MFAPPEKMIRFNSSSFASSRESVVPHRFFVFGDVPCDEAIVGLFKSCGFNDAIFQMCFVVLIHLWPLEFPTL